LSEKSHKKYHEPCVVLLDDCFCNDDVATALVDAGFVVEQFTAHFPRNPLQRNDRQQGIKDPKIISLSHKKGWVILTTDRNMRVTHVEEFKKNNNAMVVATCSNDCGDEAWVEAFIHIKIEIERRFKKQPRPWYAQINHKGELTTCQTIENQTTRRTRPKEKD
jgi:hypothetical protein